MQIAQRLDLRRIVLICALLGVALLSAACGIGGQGAGASQATPTPLPTPVVPEKPTYAVERGTVVNTLSFTGRVSPVQEQELFFKTDGFVADVYHKRGDEVEAGDLLAELEIGDLQNRLAQQQVALQTAEITLAKAEQSDRRSNPRSADCSGKAAIANGARRGRRRLGRTVSAGVNLQAAQRELAEAQEERDKAWNEARDWEASMSEPSCLPGQGGAAPCTGEPIRDRLERDRITTDLRLVQGAG